MRRDRPRLIRVLLTVVLTIASVWIGPALRASGAPGSRSGSCSSLGHLVKDGSWTWIKPPGDGGFVWYAVNPSRPDEIYAQLGDVSGNLAAATRTTLFYSGDGGCSWEKRSVPHFSRFAENHETCRNPAGPVQGSSLCHGAGWVETVIPEGDPNTLYLLLKSRAENGESPLLLVTHNKGKSWEQIDLSGLGGDGLLGSPISLDVAPSDPSRLYLSVVAAPGNVSAGRGCADCMGGLADTLYVSEDAGSSWRLAYSEPLGSRRDLVSPDPSAWRPSLWSHLVIDPLDANKVWMIGGSNAITIYGDEYGGARPKSQLWHSQDGGQTWTFMHVGDGFVGWIDVFHRPGRSARLVASGGPGILWSEDGGSQWTAVPAPAGCRQPFSVPFGKTGTVGCIAGEPTYGETSSSTVDVFRLDPRTGAFHGLETPIDRTTTSRLGSPIVDRSHRPTIFVKVMEGPNSGWLLRFTPGAR